MSEQPGRVRYLTVEEVAEFVRVSRMTVYRWIRSGDLPAVRVGRSFRIPQDGLDAFLRSSSTLPQPETRDQQRRSS
jgi:excisionase family DNA binding protein